MISSEDILIIERLILKDKLIEAVNILISISNQNKLFNNKPILILGRDLHNLRKASISGQILFKDEYYERRQISLRIINLIHKDF